MYAIVKTGGKQYKVAEGDLVKIEKIEGEPGSSVALTPVLLVDGADVKSKADDLSKLNLFLLRLKSLSTHVAQRLTS